MLNNKWHFAFDVDSRSVTLAIVQWTSQTEDPIRDLFLNCTKRQVELFFEMAETAYLLSLIEVKD